MSSAVMLIILFPQKSWWSHVPTVHQRLIGLGDPVWRSLRVAEYHQDGTSLCPGKVEDVEGSNRLRQVSAKEKWKNRSPMLSNCPHVAYVASGFFHVLKWLLMDVWWLVMSDDFWWFQRDLPVWLAAKSLEVAPRRFSPRSLKAFPQRSELELAGAQHGSEQKWEYINQFGWFRIQPISND